MNKQSFKTFTKSKAIVSLLFLTLMFVLSPSAQGQKQITGTVFHDLNGNGRHDLDEPGVSGVQVSNGRDLVTTDEAGNYAIAAEDKPLVFVIKPRGWRTTVDKNNVPRFSYFYNTDGAGGTKYPGLESTEARPGPVDFALYRQEESDTFRAVVFGDTQPRNSKEVNYIMHDTIQELVGVDAAFGITLGDCWFQEILYLMC